METVMCAGLIMSREEGSKVIETLGNAHELGYIDAPTYAAMALDALMRTVP